MTLLTVQAASEEEGDGSFRARLHGRLRRCAAVRSAPPQSATRKRVDRLPAALALAAAARITAGGLPQPFPPKPADGAPFDTVCPTGFGRGIKLATEDSKPVGSGLVPIK